MRRIIINVYAVLSARENQLGVGGFYVLVKSNNFWNGIRNWERATEHYILYINEGIYGCTSVCTVENID